MDGRGGGGGMGWHSRPGWAEKKKDRWRIFVHSYALSCFTGQIRFGTKTFCCQNRGTEEKMTNCEPEFVFGQSIW
jgi:hypothetical protein